MARGIGPLVAVLLLLLGNQRTLVVVGVGTLAVELGLCTGVDAVARGTDVLQNSVNLGRVLLRDFQAEERPHLVDDGLHAIHGIALCLGSTCLVLAHQFSPEVLRLVGHETGRFELGRCWQDLCHVGQFCLRKIRVSVLLVAGGLHKGSTAEYERCSRHSQQITIHLIPLLIEIRVQR